MATFEGVDVTAELIPKEIIATLPGNLTQDQFAVRLQDGGTMELIDSHWVIGDASFTNHSVVFAALDTLNLKGDSGIVTNGNTLVLFVNNLNSENAKILGFKDNNLAAIAGANGANPGDGGAPGQPGIGGGIVSITVVQALNGILNFDLTGQNGGSGGDGVSGVKGSTGSPGSPCQAGIGGFPPLPTCLHDGGQGGKGGTGSPGGHGGDGGAAGQGGTVMLFNVGDAPLPTATHSFTAPPGAPGIGGDGGAGGPGGDGGQGGDGNVFCHHGYPGGPGDQGQHGDQGNQGSQNAPGRILVQNLDLAAVVANANSGQVSPGILAKSSLRNALHYAEAVIQPTNEAAALA